MRAVAGRRAAVGLGTAAVVLLAVFTVFAIELSDTQAKSRQDVISRVHERSVLAAALIDSLLHSADAEVRLYEVRYGRRVVSDQALDKVRAQNTYVALLSLNGRVLARSQGFTNQAQGDLKISAA